MKETALAEYSPGDVERIHKDIADFEKQYKAHMNDPTLPYARCPLCNRMPLKEYVHLGRRVENGIEKSGMYMKCDCGYTTETTTFGYLRDKWEEGIRNTSSDRNGCRNPSCANTRILVRADLPDRRILNCPSCGMSWTEFKGKQ